MARDPRLTLSAGPLTQAHYPGDPVAANRFARSDSAGLLLGASLAVMLGALTLFVMAGERSQGEAKPLTAPAPLDPAAQFAPPPAVAPAPPLAVPHASTPAAPMAAGLSAANRARSVALIYDTSLPLAPTRLPPRPAKPGLNGAERRALDAGAVGLSPSPGAAPTILAQGRVIAGLLEVSFDPAVPGTVRAVIAAAVRSEDGRQVLIPAGSRVIGAYRSGRPAGPARAVVRWTRVLRPDGLALVLGRGPAEGSLLVSVIEAAGAGQPIRIIAARDLDFAGPAAPPDEPQS